MRLPLADVAGPNVRALGWSALLLDYRNVKNATHDQCFCSMRSLSGRLGNRIVAVRNMIGHAQSLSCGIEIPHNMLDEWTPAKRKWSFVSNNSDKISTCGSKTGREWFYRKVSPVSTCNLLPIREYFGINDSHVFGKKCPAAGHVALHIRSGDVARGSWREDGTYSGGNPHKGYGLFPTAYYLSVVREIRERRGSDVLFFVFCETMDNPTCGFFEKMSFLDGHFVMRVGKPLLEDLSLILCSSETAASRGTFNNVFQLSPAVQVVHMFSDKPQNDSSCEIVWHWISSAQDRDAYFSITSAWLNTGYQRHIINTNFNINHSALTC